MGIVRHRSLPHILSGTTARSADRLSGLVPAHEHGREFAECNLSIGKVGEFPAGWQGPSLTVAGALSSLVERDYCSWPP